jgi:phosphohistidine phosphatase
MEVYILRHGIAEDAHGGMRDEDRKLTAEGRERLAALLRTAVRGRVRPSLVLTSPYVRAVQTAEMAASELGYSGSVVETKALVPDASPQDVWTEIRTHKDEDSILLASHNPLCSRLPGYFLGAPDAQVHFGKGAMVCIEFDRFGPEPRGILRWMLSPRFGS